MRKREVTRTTYSALNAIIGMSSQLVTTLVGFISRRVFVDVLGTSMLGVNASFTSIISMISLTELGIGMAIICNLYKPLAERNEEKINSLMQLYAKVYRAIAGIVLALGLCVTPFLRLLINREIDADIDTGYLIFLYLLFLLDAVISYLFAYKRSIITADQKNFIITLVHAGALIAMNIFQIFVLLRTGSFILFLVLKVAFRLIENLVVAYLANRLYPFIRTRERYRVDRETKDNIVGNTKALALHYIGNYLINGTDMLIITRMLGTVVSGMYSNYLTITTILREVLGQFSQGITASFGNIIASGDRENLHRAFKKAMFVAFVMSNFVAVSLFCLFNPLINIWMGADKALSMPVVGIVVFNFYIVILSEPLGSLRASAGLFKPDRYLHLLLAALNLVISIGFVKIKFIGLFGVFLGTLICLIIKEMTVLPRIVYRRLLGISTWHYLRRLYTYIAITLANAALTYFVCGFVNVSGTVLTFIARAAVCAVIPNLTVLLIFRRTEEFIYLRGLAKKVLNKAFGRARRAAG